MLLHSLFKSKKIQIQEDDYNSFNKVLVKVKKILKEYVTKSDRSGELSLTVLKILLMTLLIYPRNTRDLDDVVFDLLELLKETTSGEEKKRKDGNNFDKVFTDVCLTLNSIGNGMLTEYVMKNFKNVSKYMGKGSIEVIADFLRS